MNLTFTKMHGAGNDYIYVNCMTEMLENPGQTAVELSDRHFRIGGDGLVLICPSERADAKMRMFNIDGSEGKMCGNAIRCVAKYLYDKGIVMKNPMTIDTLSGVKTLSLTVEGDKVVCVTVDMGAPILEPERIPVNLPGERIVSQPMGEDVITCVSMGNPHCVVFCDEVASLPLTDIGPAFEHAPVFPEGVNTEFIKVHDSRTLEMRVWERGSGETMACGTGACAAVVAAVLNGYCRMNEDVLVHLRGGDLTIRYTEETVYMTGGCEIAFEGTVSL